MMYEELIKRLKDRAERFDYDEWVDTAIVLEQAADAIEELQQTAAHYKGSADDWYQEALSYKAEASVLRKLLDKAEEKLTREKGKWTEFDTYSDTSLVHTIATMACSNCGGEHSEIYYDFDANIKPVAKFCPNCGAKMEGEE